MVSNGELGRWQVNADTANHGVPGAVDEEIAAILLKSPLNLNTLALGRLGAVRSAGSGAAPPAPDTVERSVHKVRGDPDLFLNVHRPRRAAKDRACLYWMHGGGYVMGTCASNAAQLDRWCEAFDCVAVSVEYRLAPEYPYPAPLEDCYAGLIWILHHADQLGITSDRIGVAGSSAGGGLAAGLALMARDRGKIALSFQFLQYPMIDDRLTTLSSRWDNAPVWPRQANAFGWRAYLGELNGDNVPAYAAAARADDLSGLPPTLLMAGSVDGFLDESLQYAQRLIHAGVSTDLRVYAGAPHGFVSIAPESALARQAARDAEDWLSRFLQRSHSPKPNEASGKD
jgi:acetyl esterase/lipase